LKDFFVSLGNSLRIYLGLFNGARPPFRGRKFLFVYEGFPYEGGGLCKTPKSETRLRKGLSTRPKNTDHLGKIVFGAKVQLSLPHGIHDYPLI
jgi:hypothetical protein